MFNLTDEEVLIFFEFCHRICETEKVAISHHAEAIVISKIAAELERNLSVPFQVDYSSKLQRARKKCLEDFEGRMGKDSWIHKIPLEQT